MKKFAALVALSFALLVTVPVPAPAAESGDKDGGDRLPLEKGFGDLAQGMIGKMILKRLDAKLSLTPEQHKQIETILDGAREKGQALRNEMRAKIKALRTDVQGQVRLLLNEKQKLEFDKLVAKMDKKMEDRGERIRKFFNSAVDKEKGDDEKGK